VAVIIVAVVHDYHTLLSRHFSGINHFYIPNLGITGGETLGQEYCTMMLAHEVGKTSSPSPRGEAEDHHHDGSRSSRGQQQEEEVLFMPLSSSRRVIAIVGDGTIAYLAQVSHHGISG